MQEEKNYINIEGNVEHIVYTNPANGYTVAEIDTETELVTAAGIMPYLAEGEGVRLMGEWTVHQSFGRQFKVEAVEKQMPCGRIAILKYLSSGIVKGIGPVSAKRIVEKFGEDALEVCQSHPDWLAQIKGITAEKAHAIGQAFAEQFGLRSVLAFCQDFFGMSAAMRMYKRWGASTVEVVGANPYILCDEIYGVGFEKADAFALAKGMAKDSPERICAAYKFILRHNAGQNGHTYIPEDKLVSVCTSLVGAEGEYVANILERCISDGALVRHRIMDRNVIYLDRYSRAEAYVARRLYDLMNTARIHKNIIDLDEKIKNIEESEGIEYAPLQKKAIKMAVESGVMVLTGGPGTGKTTIVKAILKILSGANISTELCAPTGRSAKRLSMATDCDAKTIHRLLEADPSTDKEDSYGRGEKNPLPADFIIVDEASMIDILLMEALLRAIKVGARLLIIGDKDQLPAVGAGNVLCDVIDSGVIPTVALKEIYRQATESEIIVNAHMINSGEYPRLDKRDSDFFFMPRESAEEVNDTVVELVRKRLPAAYKEKSRDVQVIIPSRKGKNGTEALNVILQNSLNPPSREKNEFKFADKIFREGDKVMQIRNDYNITWTDADGNTGSAVYNGDIGTVVKIDKYDERLFVEYDGKLAAYEFPMLDELELAYAVTVHKSQGSEYPIVVLPLCDFPRRLQIRNLLYTAITRAQKILVVVGRKEVIYRMVDNYKQSRRYTGLADAIAEYSF